MGPAGTGKRIFSLRTMDQDSDDEDEVPMPPIPDPSWVRPDRHADANTEAVKAAWAEAREQVVSELSGWAHKTNIRVQNSNKKDLSKFTIKSEIDLERMLKTRCRVAGLAHAATTKKKNSDAKLPDLTLEDDEVWALVDSGSTLNAAWIKKHFPQ